MILTLWFFWKELVCLIIDLYRLLVILLLLVDLGESEHGVDAIIVELDAAFEQIFGVVNSISLEVAGRQVVHALFVVGLHGENLLISDDGFLIALCQELSVGQVIDDVQLNRAVFVGLKRFLEAILGLDVSEPLAVCIAKVIETLTPFRV